MRCAYPRAPVIFSHANAKAICDVPRNVPDDILKRLHDNGGVIMVSFVGGLQSATRSTAAVHIML